MDGTGRFDERMCAVVLPRASGAGVASPANGKVSSQLPPQSVGLQPILVFDGARHDMKESHAGAARKKLRDVAVATLNEILARADGSDMAAADKARKGIAYVREDIVAMVRKWCVDDKNV